MEETKRNEIAECSEKAYEGLPVSDAATLLYFKTASEASDFFAKVRLFFFVNA